MTTSKFEELKAIRRQLRDLEVSITKQSLKSFVVCGLELYLSFTLVIELFECKDESVRDEQELQYLYSVAWIPPLASLCLAFGHQLAPSYAPALANLDRNLRATKIAIWLYSLILLIHDPDMQLKQGPGLQVGILFCVCDMARFEMEVARLIDSGEDDDDDEDSELAKLARAAMVQDPGMSAADTARPQTIDVDDRDDHDHQEESAREDRSAAAPVTSYLTPNTPDMLHGPTGK